jgi:hypothetical protein
MQVGGVAIDIITEAWPDGDDVKAGGVCGNFRLVLLNTFKNRHSDFLMMD